jgi:CBS domain containing-hemolysin-like protein
VAVISGDLTQAIWRTLLVVMAFYGLYQLPWLSPLITATGLALLATLLIFWLEWLAAEGGRHAAEAWALGLVPLVRVLAFVLAPLTALPLALSGADSSDNEESQGSMVEELKTLVDAGERDGTLELGEQRMLRSIFELGDTLAREIMVPRIDILALEASTSLAAAVDALLETGHTRVPVYEDSVDNVLGLLYAKDLLRVWREGDTTGSLKDLLRPAYFVPEAKKVNELLDEMQARRIHMAIVIDEYGGVAGLVTLEDIVEEIIGEVRDEFDQLEESPYQEIEEGEIIFLGRVDLDDFNGMMGTNLLKDEADTIGGFMYNRIGRVPESGESIHVEELELTAEQVSGRRIRKIRARRIIPLPRNEGGQDDHS